MCYMYVCCGGPRQGEYGRLPVRSVGIVLDKGIYLGGGDLRVNKGSLYPVTLEDRVISRQLRQTCLY